MQARRRTNRAVRNDPGQSQSSQDKEKPASHNLECRFLYGGARRNRTADLLNAIQALSQLSYGPGFFVSHLWVGAKANSVLTETHLVRYVLHIKKLAANQSFRKPLKPLGWGV